MAGGGLKMDQKLRASTIVEVLVSLIVIVIVFGIAMSIFANVQRSSLSTKKLRAQAILKAHLLKASQHPEVSKQTVTDDGFTLEQNITNYHDDPALYQISLIAYDANSEKVSELTEVFYEGK